MDRRHARARRESAAAGPEALTAEELIASALYASNDEDRYWQLVYQLQDRGTAEIFSAACALTLSETASERVLGVRILSQGQSFTKTFRDEVELLLQLLESESDADVLAALGSALGHWQEPRAIHRLSELRAHPSANVRFGVVMGMVGHDDPVAIRTLIGLSEDVDTDVRDWATFGLGSQIDRDTDEIRSMLERRLDDSDADTRLEALVGLARRKDERALAPLLEELSQEKVASGALEAAEAFADPRLCDALVRLRGAGVDAVSAAIRSCSCET